MLPFSRFNRYFQEVANQGNLRKAAEALHVSASAIDRQIIQAGYCVFRCSRNLRRS
jgi:hypothetical protein